MKHTIEIDDQRRDIEIRAMDQSFIVYRKMFLPPLTPENIGQVNPGDPEYLAEQFADGQLKIMEEFFRKQVESIGSCMILAWNGCGVIGKMHFTTREMHETIKCGSYGAGHYDPGCGAYGPGCYCVDCDEFAPAIEKLTGEQMERCMRSESRTLRVLCFNIGHFDERYQGQGIATAMLEYLGEWARQRSRRRIEIGSCHDITPSTVIGDWMLRRGFLERRGFRVVEERAVPPEQAEVRLRIIEALAAGEENLPDWANRYVRDFPRLHADSTWKSLYDKDYLMARDL